MSEGCCAAENNVLILACSGASNLGQLANQAAVELTREGFGKMSCLAAVGAHIDHFVQSVQKADTLVVIDGCAVHCAKRSLDHAGVTLSCYVVLYDLGLEKTMNTTLDPAEVEKVKSAVRDACGRRITVVPVNAGPSPSACG